MNCIMGIDPGLSGGIAFYYPDTGRAFVQDVPLRDGIVDPNLVKLIIDYHNPQLAVVEKVHSMPKQGVKSTFNFGHAAGVLFGVTASTVKTVLISPRVWKKYMGLDSSKEAARKLALKYFFDDLGIVARLKRKKDHNRAEALLIALYGANTLK